MERQRKDKKGDRDKRRNGEKEHEGRCGVITRKKGRERRKNEGGWKEDEDVGDLPKTSRTSGFG